MKKKNILKINAIYFTAISLVAVIFLFGYLGWLKNDIITSFLIQIVVMFGIPMLMYGLLFKKSFKETCNDIGLKKISTKMVGISILLGIILYFINSFVADAFASIIALFGYESISSSATSSFNYGTLIKEFILSCILPGFCEEVLHRGIMLHANKKFSNTKFCLIISSIIFGLTHLNIRQFFYAAILGFLMGYVSLVANSIIPSIIIHFMNNFLSTYFFYGTYLNWPLAKLVNFATNIFLKDIFIFVSSSTVAVALLLMAYHYLTKKMLKERAKNDVQKILTLLKNERISLEEAQSKLNTINLILKEKHIKESNKPKPSFLELTFLISSIVLGAFITISSFIWGVI
ncbi:MAG: CPBP family intramembrane metalloprotease [Clostridia bacterium]|nr:CPBP family intramembrane metalloprotease [Clostridia bacterium]